MLESTTYPGTTRDVVLPILAATGLNVGQDFFLAFSPEREDPGNPRLLRREHPQGGRRDRSATAAGWRRCSTGRRWSGSCPVSSCEVAEACKILENTYRSVNIAMVNELKMLFDRLGIDVWEVIDAAKTKPFGFQAFYPGPGLGGHCIPIDPFYLTWLARKHGMATRFIELAGEINTGMPQYVVRRLIDALNEAGKPLRGSKVCVLGRGLQEGRRRPAGKPVVRAHGIAPGGRGGAELQRSARPAAARRCGTTTCRTMASAELTPEFLAGQDCVLIATDHSAYDYDAIVRHAPLVVDTRNATKNVSEGRWKIRKA